MLLLLDECVPRPLKPDLVGHDVRHVTDMGWSSKRNGELLRLMVAERSEALLTVDQNLEFSLLFRNQGFPLRTRRRQPARNHVLEHPRVEQFN